MPSERLNGFSHQSFPTSTLLTTHEYCRLTEMAQSGIGSFLTALPHRWRATAKRANPRSVDPTTSHVLHLHVHPESPVCVSEPRPDSPACNRSYARVAIRCDDCIGVEASQTPKLTIAASRRSGPLSTLSHLGLIRSQAFSLSV